MPGYLKADSGKTVSALVRMAGIVLLMLSVSGCSLFKPERCPIPGCHVRMIHMHGGKEFRGVPWWKINKNPKIGQDYKPQSEF
ncbi:MAG: hypothetical protein V4543_13650 [Bacteroidota bacterium]